MAMFGNAMAMGQPSGLGNILSILGAGLKDASPTSGGGNLEAQQQLMFQRAMYQRQQQMLGELPGLFGGQAPGMAGAPSEPVMTEPGTGPTMKGPGEDGSPIGPAEKPPTYAAPQTAAPDRPGEVNWARIAAMAPLYKSLGIDLAPAIEALKAGQPSVKIGPDGTAYNEHDGSALSRRFANRTAVNGQIIDLNDPGNTNRAIPTAPVPGANPIYNNRGEVIDWALPGGAARAIGAAEAAKVGASEASKLPYVGPTAYAQASGTKAGELPFAGPIAQATSAGTAAGSGPYENITVDVGGKPVTMSKAQFAALQGGNGTAPSATFGSAQATDAVRRLLPGAMVTSGARSATRNSAVGGVPDSLHLADGAIDFVPPKGADINAFKAKLAQAGLPASELINEGNHWHWGFAPKGAQAPGPQAAGGITGANKEDQKTVQGYRDTATQLENLASLGDRFSELNKKQASGPGYRPLEVPVPFAHHEVDINIPGALARQYQAGVPAMANLTNQLALAQRSAGMRITQMEFQKFLGSAPGIDNLPKQNDTIISGYHDLASQRRAYANFASNYLAKNGSLTGMDQAWAEQSRAATAGPKVRTYNPKTGGLE